jgi:uncharacterized membrane protein
MSPGVVDSGTMADPPPKPLPALVWRPVRDLSESDAVLWGVVIVASAFDIVTTIVGVDRGAAEGNAVARAFIETYGTPGIGLLKFVALVVVVVLWSVLDDRNASAVLLAFALVSLLVVALNALTLASL